MRRTPLTPIFDPGIKHGSIEVGSTPGGAAILRRLGRALETDTAGPIGSTVFSPDGCENFNTGSTVSWDAHYSRSDWPLFGDLGGGSFSISGGVASFNGLIPAKEIKHNATTDRNAWVSAINQTDYTTGVDRHVRLIINAGRDGTGFGAGTSSYYYGFMGRTGGASTVAIGKWWNGNEDVTLASAAQALVPGDVVRIRHDGAGNLYLDVNGVQVLSATDTAGPLGQVLSISGTSVYLRATGVGLGGVTTQTTGGNNVSIDSFCWGTWETSSGPFPVVPSNPWFVADHLDTDTLASGLWAKDPSNGNLSITFDGPHYGFHSPSSTDYAELVDESLLSADQFVEATIQSVSSVEFYTVILRSASSSSGYYFTTHFVNGFPDDDFYWRIGIVGGAVLATAASPFFTGTVGPSGRVRAEAEGTTLRCYWNDVLQVSVSDGSIGAANTVRLNPNGNGGQAITQLSHIIVGNL